MQEIVRNPDGIAGPMALASGKELVFRLLQGPDAEPLGRYFEGLSTATRRLYGPHAFSGEVAERFCEELDYRQVMRFIAVTDGGRSNPGEPPGRAARGIVAYFIVVIGFWGEDPARYRGYGLNLDGRLVCTLAPSVADAWQNSGVGSAMMERILAVMRGLGFRWMVLMGGTQAGNERAIHFYRKFGFRTVGEFRTTCGNYDMVAEL